MLVGTLWRAINKHHHRTRTPSKKVQRNVVGTQIYVHTNDKDLIEDSQVGHPTEY